MGTLLSTFFLFVKQFIILIEKIITTNDDLKIAFQLNSLVIQPTTLCNLNCSYCYLPDRNKNLIIEQSTVSKIVEELTLLNPSNTINIIWHSGEVLVIGYKRFFDILSLFELLRISKKIRHSLQTNGILINQEWCELFIKFNIAIGVSIDGPRYLSKNRVDWKNEQVFDKVIMGINNLKKYKVSFGIICVVDAISLNKAEELYDFFCNLGCTSVGFNIVEEDGINKNNLIDASIDTKIFWKQLLAAWMNNPKLGVREFRRTTVWLQSELHNRQSNSIVKDLIPLISYNGEVVLLSPEFLSVDQNSLKNTFVVGNILKSSITEIIETGLNSSYVKDYILGINKCYENCKYFSYCRGGDASNKYFEKNKLDVMETNFCINTKQNLVRSILEIL